MQSPPDMNFWAGSQWNSYDERTKMLRIGQRPLIDGKRYNVMASDIERWPSFFSKVNSGHPDFDKLSDAF